MARIWIGYSESLGFKELIVSYIDPFFAPVSEKNDEPVGLLISDFGASQISPGDFEVYENDESPEAHFDFEHVMGLFPFSDRPHRLEGISWDKVRSVFFIRSNENPRKFHDDHVTITDTMDVTFHWE